MKQKKVIALALAGCMAVSLAACGSGGTGGSGGSGSAGGTDETSQAAAASGADETASGEEGNKEDITISIISRYGSDAPDEAFFRQQVDQYNAMDNGVTVESDTITTETEYYEKVRTSFASGDTPNIFLEYGGSRTIDYVESDAIIDMQPYFDEDPDWYNSFFPSMFGDLTYDEYPGIWGVPYKAYTVSLYYNKEIFEKNNLTPPESWDDLMNVCQKLTDAGVKPFQFGDSDPWRFGHLLNNMVYRGLGTDAAYKLADRSLGYDSPEMIDIFQKMIDMIDKGYLGTDLLSTDYNTEKSVFASGDSAMFLGGSWYIAEIEGTEFYDKVGVVSFPYLDEKYKDQAQGGASDMWFISKLGKSEEEIQASVDFIKWLTSQEQYLAYRDAAAAIYPVGLEASEEASNPLLDEVNGLVDTYSSMMTDIQNVDPDSQSMDVVRNALQGLAMGTSAEDTGKSIQEQLSPAE